MKILLISTNADEAGAPRHVEAVVNGLASDFAFTLAFGEEGPVSERLTQRGHNLHIIREMRTAISPIKDFVALLKVMKLIWKVRPDVIHCHSAKAGMLGRIAAFFLGKKWIYTVHGWGWRGVPKVTMKLVLMVEAMLSKLPRGFYIYVAKDVLIDARIVLNIKAENGKVVYNGVSLIDADLPATDVPLVVMMPARVSSAKDHQSLIAAFELINDPGIRLILCGAGTDSEDFIGFVKSLAPNTYKSISFLGQRSDMQRVYSQAHVVALISNFEALPLSIIEAMSCSRAVIATKIGGIPELIENGVNGLLVEPNSVDEIVGAINRCKQEKFRVGLGIEAKKTYENFFTEKSMLVSTAQIYRSHGKVSQ